MEVCVFERFGLPFCLNSFFPYPYKPIGIKPDQKRTPQYFQSVPKMMTSSFSDLSFGELAGCVDVTVSVEI